MDEKILPLLEYVDKGKLGNVRFSDVERNFDKNTIDQTLYLRYIEVHKKNGERLCGLTPEGYRMHMANKSRKEQNVSSKEQNVLNRKALIISIIGVLIALAALLVVIFHFQI